MEAYTAALSVCRTLHNAGFEAYLVGGCVRDTLLGRTPKDFDVTTNARPEQVMSLFEKTIPVGAAFGVIVVMHEGNQIEVATFRTDGQYSDARRPDVVFYSDSAKEDVIRRDFTINGMLLMPCLWGDNIPQSLRDRLEVIETIDREQNPDSWTLHDGSQAIVDYVSGREDIDAKVIRCIGDAKARFTEDALRMLRAVRFAAQLGFEIEEETKKAILELGPTITKVSRERIREELLKLLMAPFATRGISLLFSTGLARHIFTSKTTSAMNLPMVLEKFERFRPATPEMALAMFFENLKLEVRSLCRDLKLSNEQFDEIVGAVTEVESVLAVHYYNQSVAIAKRLMRKAGAYMAVKLAKQHYVISGIEDAGLLATLDRLAGYQHEELYPAPLVTGDDLIAMGYAPGRNFKTVLMHFETEQLNGVLTSRETALSQVHGVFAEVTTNV